MKELSPKERIKQEVLPAYYEATEWLHTFITDPEGERYLVEKTPEERLQEYQEQITRMETFLNFLGNPQNEFKSIHIAGTSGKGSTSMIIGKTLEGMSSKVGVHTSPYLQVPGEKFLINNKIIPPSRFVKIINKLKDKHREFQKAHPETDLRYGEMQVAFNNLYFAENNLDWGVIETGMGGRFDPTNVLNPALSVITNVDFDHVPQLGTKLPEIAWHKAGIIKPKTPIITAETKEEALTVIREEAVEKNAKLFVLGTDFDWEVISINNEGITITVNGPYNTYKNFRIPLLGPFQAKNAGLAIAAVDILFHQHQFSTNAELINEVLRNLNFPGRMEVIQGEPTVILDGAHNPQKMAALAEAIEKLYPGKKFILICGMLGTKDASFSFSSLIPNAKRIITTKPQVVGKPGIEALELANIIKAIGYDEKIDVYSDVLKAIDVVLKEAKQDDIILITGSLYMLGKARNYWVHPESLLLEAELQF